MKKEDLTNPKIIKNVKKYFFSGLDLVDEGANGEEFSFFKRLEQGGENQMVERVEAPELPANKRKEILSQLDKKEGLSVDALAAQQAEYEAMEAELKQAESENMVLKEHTFEEAKAGIEPSVRLIDPNTMQPIEVQKEQGVMITEQELVNAEIIKLENENMRLKLDRLRAENEMLKRSMPQPIGMSRKTEVRLQTASDAKDEKPLVEKNITEYNRMTEIMDDFVEDLRGDPNLGIISGG